MCKAASGSLFVRKVYFSPFYIENWRKRFLVEESKVQRRYTLTIPKKIREALGIEEGEKVVWRVRRGEIVIKPETFRLFHARFPGASGYMSEKDKEEAEEAFLRETG